MGELGLGDLEDVMAAAAGDSVSVPSFLPDTPEVKQAFELLGSESTDLSKQLLVEKFGETLYQTSGWTAMAEQMNGRAAMIGVVAGMGAIFQGGVLTQAANAPLPTFLVILAVVTGTLVPATGEAEAKGYIPENVRKTVDEFYISAGADKFFSSKAEMINGRAAMVGFAALLALDIIF